MKPTFKEFEIQLWHAITCKPIGFNKAKLRALYDAMLAPEELRPMESAPRDEEYYLLYHKDGDGKTPMVLTWWHECWINMEHDWCDHLEDKDFIGWLPLPTVNQTKEG